MADPSSGLGQLFDGNIDRHVARGVDQRGEQNFGLARFATAQLDHPSPGSEGGGDVSRPLFENGGLDARRIILLKVADFDEEGSAAGVVEVLAGQGLGRALQASEHLAPELGSVDGVGHRLEPRGHQIRTEAFPDAAQVEHAV